MPPRGPGAASRTAPWWLASRASRCPIGTRAYGARQFVGGDGGESNSPSRTLRQGPLRACPMVCRQPSERPSAGSRSVQSRVPRSGFERRYVALAPFASSLDDASTAREEEAASTLTLLPKQRGREQAGGCQLLLFVAFLRGQSDILGSRSLVAGPCRIHASPRPSNLRSTEADHPTRAACCQATRFVGSVSVCRRLPDHDIERGGVASRVGRDLRSSLWLSGRARRRPSGGPRRA